MDAKTIKLAVFGQPVAHSLSPRIHRAFGEQLGMDVDYRAIEAAADQLEARLDEFRANGGTGANLTVPLKEQALRLCAQVDVAARQSRAVNTLMLVNDGWHGYNTDGAGFLLDLDRLGIELADRRILVIGAGGATAGILPSMLEREPHSVCLLNRTAERAERLSDKFSHRGNVNAGALEEGPEEEDFDLLVQSTSAGHAGALPAINRAWLATSATVYDLNYGNAHQALARWARAHELPCHDGLGMLVGQAALAFEIWTGQQLEMSPVLEALHREAKDC